MKEDLRQQIAELTSVYKDPFNIVVEDSEIIVSGTLLFEASADSLEEIKESFELELKIPHSYPDSLPRVKETGGRIVAEYEHRFQDGTLCLAVPIEQRRIFFEQPTILGFVNKLVIPYLYGYSYWEKHGRHPFGEAAHGHDGILRHYVDTLCLPNDLAALAVICFLFEHGYRGHHDCPCGSGLKVRTCHGQELRGLHEHHTPQTLQKDFVTILDKCSTKFQNGELSIPQSLRFQLARILKKSKN